MLLNRGAQQDNPRGEFIMAAAMQIETSDVT
jgi:hypothetical protein